MKDDQRINFVNNGNIFLNWHDDRAELYEGETSGLLNTAYSTREANHVVAEFSPGKSEQRK